MQSNVDENRELELFTAPSGFLRQRVLIGLKNMPKQEAFEQEDIKR
jgi:hypothetical protein